jgi:Domain of unknown function DUF1828/Domain of unknown function DUF1829
MIEETQELILEHVAWLKDRFFLEKIDNDWIQVTTPYIDRYNDYIQIYIKREGKDFVITDDGYTITDLRHSGCDFKSKKRQKILISVLNGFNVELIGDALSIKATRSEFARKEHNLIQAIAAVNNLSHLAAATIKGVFLEDVEKWLLLSEIKFSPRVKLLGNSGYEHLFNFVTSEGIGKPKKFIQAFSKPNRTVAEKFAFSWIDTKDLRENTSKAYAIINDLEYTPKGDVLRALDAYDINSIFWSERSEARRLLAV